MAVNSLTLLPPSGGDCVPLPLNRGGSVSALTSRVWWQWHYETKWSIIKGHPWMFPLWIFNAPCLDKQCWPLGSLSQKPAVWHEQLRPHGEATCRRSSGQSQLSPAFESSQPRHQICEQRSLQMILVPVIGALPVEAPDSVEQSQAVPTVPCPDFWHRESMGIINGCFTSLHLEWFVTWKY